MAYKYAQKARPTEAWIAVGEYDDGREPDVYGPSSKRSASAKRSHEEYLDSYRQKKRVFHLEKMTGTWERVE